MQSLDDSFTERVIETCTESDEETREEARQGKDWKEKMYN